MSFQEKRENVYDVPCNLSVTKDVPSLTQKTTRPQAADRVTPPSRFLTPMRNDARTWQVKVHDPSRTRQGKQRPETCGVGVSLIVDKCLLLGI